MAITNTDSKGRVTLGPRFANREVVIEEINESSLRIILASAIPVNEAWLYANKKALAAVRKGLNQARAGKTSKAPNLRKR
ncbi:MAG TPA: hypothetical protein DCM28_17935 [Phycisphaerales bacterium]|nr:hypothetical protein [Phycisphaerales bacterium]HCD35037.1 hypothetical protein [Phycisphaerales bacterium]|tara:strand:- start:100 stop:339 length:240 start_codon:yes stop_codon:yes gene_type:complete